MIIEDGTGLPNAESYVSAEDCIIYAGKRGLVFSDDPLGEAALRRATAWVDGYYSKRLKGERTNGRAQALAWPRKNVIDCEGNALPDNEVPKEIINATCEAATRELKTPNILSPDFNPAKRIISAAVSGAVSVTYADGGAGIEAQRLVISSIDDLLGCILKPPLAGGKSMPAVSGENIRL